MMSNACAQCCQDMVLPIRHLLLPEAYLDADGLEFMRVHGMTRMRNGHDLITFDLHGFVFKFSARQLLWPEVYLAEGVDRDLFYRHDLDVAIRENAVVRVQHRCEQLTADGLCAVYPSRPKLCREFDCATRECSRSDPQATNTDKIIPLVAVH